MYHENKLQIHLALFISCVFFTIISPSYNQKIVQAKSEEKTATGMASGVVQTISNTGEVDRKKDGKGLTHSGKLEDGKTAGISKKYTDSNSGTMERGVEYKIDKLIEVGIIPEIAESLVTNCKKQDIAVVNCIKLGASIAVSESGGGKRCNKNGCFGILGGVRYNTIEEGVEDWVKRFGKYWLNQKTPDSFYSNSPNWNPKTRYCMSERQPDGSILPYCKNGHKHAWNIFKKLEKLF